MTVKSVILVFALAFAAVGCAAVRTDNAMSEKFEYCRISKDLTPPDSAPVFLWSFRVGQKYTGASSIPELSEKIGFKSNKDSGMVGLFDYLGERGWILVCADSDTYSTGWNFRRRCTK
jgi:hypothetical protein